MPTVATAGHVDHGKSTLVRALTGTDPDRLAEERRRGLTIDLGFASTTLTSGRTVGFVDVPGHERYLSNMLAGAGAVRSCLLVVAADEGWREQTQEHLTVLELLGVADGFVVVSKCDTVDADVVDLATAEVEERLLGSFLEGAPVVAADALAGTGLDRVRAALEGLLDRMPAPPDAGRVRLWVDRSFAVDGAGTVVTGTLAGGRLAVGDPVEVVRAGAAQQPRPVRVRAMQHHHGPVTCVGPGERVAVNLSGLSHREVGRGDAVVGAGRWFLTDRLDASVDVLPALGHDLSRRGAFTLHVGSGQHPVRVRVLGPDRIRPGQRGAVRLHLPGRLPLLPGDRYVLRESGRNETVGGGEVLDVDPVLRAARARPDRSVERVVAERGRITVGDLELRTGVRLAATVGGWVVDPVELARAGARLRDVVAAAGAAGVRTAELDGLERALAARDEALVVRDGVVRTRAADRDAAVTDHAWLATLRADPLGGAAPDGVDPADLRELRRSGRVVLVDGAWFARDALDALTVALARLLSEQPAGVAIAEVREALGGTRRTIVPFLTWCDAQGMTRRRGDRRIAGPRLPRP